MFEEEARTSGGAQCVLLGRSVTKIGTNPDVGKGQMGVRLDQTRHECPTVTVNDPCSVRGQHHAIRRDRSDAIAVHQHLRGKGRRTGAVEDRDVLEHDSGHSQSRFAPALIRARR